MLIINDWASVAEGSIKAFALVMLHSQQAQKSFHHSYVNATHILFVLLSHPLDGYKALFYWRYIIRRRTVTSFVTSVDLFTIFYKLKYIYHT